MKVYITDANKITKFILPNKIEESFLIPYKINNDSGDYFVTIEARGGYWVLKSNGNININNGDSYLDEVIIDNYSYNQLKVVGNAEILSIYTLPSMNESFYRFNINTNIIMIGSNSQCTIWYNTPIVENNHAKIEKKSDGWYILSLTVNTYVNDVVIKEKKLNIGDVIFINGLKIIWMQNFIEINNPNNQVKVNGLQHFQINDMLNNTRYSRVTDDEASISLYKSDDYFFHTPRMINVLSEEVVQIDPPPNSEQMEEMPFILTIGSSLTMAISSLVTGYNALSGIFIEGKTVISVLPSLLMCFSMVIGFLIMPRVISNYNKKRKIKREQLRQTKYRTYLNDKVKIINNILKKQSDVLNENYLTASECRKMILEINTVSNESVNKILWGREIKDNDFLTIRLGKGSLPAKLTINAPEEHFTLDEDNLRDEVYGIVNNSKMLNSVPIIMSLNERNLYAFIFNCSYQQQYLDNIMLQLITLHSAIDLKIVIVTDEEGIDRWKYTKVLPHCWNNDKTIRFFSSNARELKQISNFLEEEYKLRKELKNEQNAQNEDREEINYRNFLPYYLIICDNCKLVKNDTFFENLFNSSQNIGFTFIAIDKTMKRLPNQCEVFIQIGEKESGILTKELNSDKQTVFINECDPTIDMYNLSIKLANIPIATRELSNSLPSTLSFLEMFNVSKIEQLNIMNRWQTNNPVASLATPVGIHANGDAFILDLHEKFHGPHGLIAGSTGSGKSEFIITFILSMAVNYHPYEVQFVLIDYKGGGLAGAFENTDLNVRLPHLAGTITNLDISEINRTLVSIESEVKRRQSIFNDVKKNLGESTLDIYKYQKLYREGVVKVPMSHLFIISDEFAELKSQQPEFMQQLISISRIGRSLGVHLILATQKPSGVVNDQIWSNSRFKVCLKVQSKSDSMEMLKRPEAASIKEIGRFYLQIGYDDYFDIGQSGWSGARYIPTDKIVKKVDDSINFIDNIGNVIKSINDDMHKNVSADIGDQLTNIVKYISNISNKLNIQSNRLWLPAIPGEIYISNLINKYAYKPIPYLISPVIGEYDNPSGQKQGILNLNLTEGNCLIYGQSGSGKENLLSTIIWSVINEHTPLEVNLYIIDCGAEILKIFKNIPHVGEVVTSEDNEKIVDIFKLVNDEMDIRKDEFADFGGDYISYCKNSGKTKPMLILIINNFEVFSELYFKLSDVIGSITRDSVKYGIVFIISATTTNSLRTRIVQNFNNKIMLQVPNVSDYRAILDAPKGLYPAKIFGRGLIAMNIGVYEFQTAYICQKDNIKSAVKDITVKMNDFYKVKAEKVLSIPEFVTLNLMNEYIKSLTSIPIGMDINTKKIYCYDFYNIKYNMILANDINEHLPFLNAIIREFNSISNTNIKVIDFIDIYNNFDSNIKVCRNNFDDAFKFIFSEIKKNMNANLFNIYIFIGMGNIRKKVSKDVLEVCNYIFSNSSINNYIFVFFDNYNSHKNLQLEPWYHTQFDNSNGIWLGNNFSNQVAINATNISLEDRKMDFKNMAFAVRNGNHTIIKYVVDDLGDNNG